MLHSEHDNVPLSVTNTCPLDSFLMSFCLMHKCKVVVQPLHELSNPDSLMSRAFAFMDENPGMDIGGDRARTVFIDHHFNRHFVQPNQHNTINLWTDVDVFFFNTVYKNKEAGISPILDSIKLSFTERKRCDCKPTCKRRATYCSSLANPSFAGIAFLTRYLLVSQFHGF